MGWGIQLFMAIGGVVLLGNFVYWVFLAKVDPSPSDPKPSRFHASETVWYDGDR